MTKVDSGWIKLNGANPTGKAGVVQVLSATFTVAGTVGDSTTLDLEFEATSGAVPTFTNLLPALSVADTSVRVAGATDARDQTALPASFALMQNYPNPFVSGKDSYARINFDVPARVSPSR